MNPIVDGIMLTLFLFFMIFIFAGYHKRKSGEREEQFRVEEERKNNLNE